MPKALCSRCGLDPVKACGLCGACLRYRERTGRNRPPELIVKHVERVVEKDAERDAWRQ